MPLHPGGRRRGSGNTGVDVSVSVRVRFFRTDMTVVVVVVVGVTYLVFDENGTRTSLFLFLTQRHPAHTSRGCPVDTSADTN